MRHVPTSPRLVAFARDNRKDQSRAEKELWTLLRDRRLGAKFRRQHPVGPFIADFASVAAKLIVEVDGRSHHDDEQAAYDARRTQYFDGLHWRVLRVSEGDVLNDPARVMAMVRAMLLAER